MNSDASFGNWPKETYRKVLWTYTPERRRLIELGFQQNKSPMTHLDRLREQLQRTKVAPKWTEGPSSWTVLWRRSQGSPQQTSTCRGKRRLLDSVLTRSPRRTEGERVLWKSNGGCSSLNLGEPKPSIGQIDGRAQLTDEPGMECKHIYDGTY